MRAFKTLVYKTVVKLEISHIRFEMTKKVSAKYEIRNPWFVVLGSIFPAPSSKFQVPNSMFKVLLIFNA